MVDKPAQLLIVDDNELNRDMLSRRLERCGYRVAVAANGKDVLDRVRQDRTDLVLLDIEMPVVSGLDVLASLRRNYSPGQLPVIMVTAKNQSEEIVRALDLGANDYITKPVDFPVALARVRTQLSYKLAEDQIRYQQALLKCQSEASLDGILLLSSNGDILSFNQRFLEMWQLNAVDKNTIDGIADYVADRDSFLARFREDTARSGNQDEIVLRDGRTFEYYGAPIVGEEAVHYGRVWYFRDITRRKQTQLALRESEERYALAARGANDGIWDWNVIAGSVFYSARWKSLLGYADNEIGESPEEWFGRLHPADSAPVKASLQAHFEGATPNFESEHRILHKDTTYRWVLTRGVGIRDTSGRVLRMAGSQTDITERKMADALTGLPNRLLLADRLGRMIEHQKRRPDYLFAVLLLDVDDFQTINNSLGPILGDQLLMAVARRLEKCLRTSDTLVRLGGSFTLSRLGGDEFAILLDDLRDPADATRVAERILEDLAAPFHLQEREIFTSVSLGIAMSKPGQETSEDILRDADTAMNRAKSTGKARCEVFDPAMRATVMARLDVETGLRRAVERKELRNLYQPIVSLESGRIVGFETLMRWQHPTRGLLPPGEFMSIAEETGLILPMGWWTLEDACRQLGAWRATHPVLNDLMISVNLSPRQFLQSDLPEQVESLLRRMGLPPSRLKLEITESMVISDPIKAGAMLAQLKSLGIELAMDDFGTGYSSLSYLHRFPLDFLKIDRSFVGAMNTRHESLEIVRTILALARHLRLKVVAEGIETPEQFSQLKNLGCQFGQGYYFSQPMAAEAAERFATAEPALKH